MKHDSDKRKRSDFVTAVIAVFLVATAVLLLVLTLALLKRNGTLDEWKTKFVAWQKEREARGRDDEDISVTFFGSTGISEYESWFLLGGAVYPVGAAEGDGQASKGDDTQEGTGDGDNQPKKGIEDERYAAVREKRKGLLSSPVTGEEAWWTEAVRLTDETYVYAQADTPLLGAPSENTVEYSKTAAGECMQLVAIISDNWYVVSDGIWQYCSKGECYTLVEPEVIDFAAICANMDVKRVQHEVTIVKQLPELPHGCEVTALTGLFAYYGIDVDKCELADNWLPKGEWGETNYWQAFVGNPRISYRSAGCYAPVIADTANRYLASIGRYQVDAGNAPAPNKGNAATGGDGDAQAPQTLSFHAVAHTGISFGQLLSMVKQNPILVWTTMELESPYIAQVFTVDGKELLWQNCEHCVVLTGYDLERGILYGMDPLYGACEYDMKLFSLRFRTMYSQTVEIITHMR